MQALRNFKKFIQADLLVRFPDPFHGELGVRFPLPILRGGLNVDCLVYRGARHFRAGPTAVLARRFRLYTSVGLATTRPGHGNPHVFGFECRVRQDCHPEIVGCRLLHVRNNSTRSGAAGAAMGPVSISLGICSAALCWPSHQKLRYS
jgi:hypothetical protein